ncbi:hypothetical protein [Hymenobacter metallicola]|uniref:Uncharacterized protein n=1 Tax=Hymenobacter metallicola TaxID=2563114 RepID=A0A4Z0PT12_9BACT|nr:hypothetical protein [Hymenobacter metallicola]TGE20867.1 hypothetical protein E5K02_25020 [Hymenobacter metallicola]
MKISVEKGQEKGFLPDGRHTVEITAIEEGQSEHQNVPFFAARMENEEGFVVQRFYTSPTAMPILLSLYAAVGIHPQAGKDLDTKELIGKRVSVEIGEHSYADPATGNERSIKQATGFRTA